MLAFVLHQTKRLLLSEYESIVRETITSSTTHWYPLDMHGIIEKNDQLEKTIQSKIVLNKKFFNQIQKSKIFSIHLITEAWCLDASILLPLLRSIEIIRPEIKIYSYLRDQNESLMNQYLTNGAKAIPVLFGLDERGNEIFRWGPRSKKAIEILESINAPSNILKSDVLREFYTLDLNESIQIEWIDLLR